jgi:hypothetical protein
MSPRKTHFFAAISFDKTNQFIKTLLFFLCNLYSVAHRLGIEAVAAFIKGTTSEKPETIAAQIFAVDSP